LGGDGGQLVLQLLLGQHALSEEGNELAALLGEVVHYTVYKCGKLFVAIFNPWWG
jgi:hypothetical protein